jgi:type I restriction enzyme S subunit
LNALKKYKFSELYEMGSGISTKPEQAGHGAPFCSFTTVFNNYFLPPELPDRMDTSVEEQETYSLKEGDVLLTRTSETLDELGMSSVAVKNYPKATFSGFLKRLRPTQTDVVYHKFLAFYLRSPLFRKAMNNNAVMTLRCSLNEQIFSYLDLLLPEFDQQKKIGDLLFQIYAKIELNNRINAELEGMAKLLYDYWFVQFDFPMTAAQAAVLGKPHLTGHPYRASGGKMIYNETLKREIPEGWEATTLSQFANITMGQSPPGDSYNQKGSGMVFFQGSTDFGWRYPQVREFTTAPSRFAKAGDILLSVRAPVGTLNIADQACCIGRGLAALNAKSGHDSFLFEVMLYFKTIFDRRNASGTTFGSITKDDLHSLEFACPSTGSPLLDAFEEKMKPAHKTILNNHQQNQELTQLRDWLLPMLMNGQVTVG